jgi:hypothetical protein
MPGDLSNHMTGSYVYLNAIPKKKRKSKLARLLGSGKKNSLAESVAQGRPKV